MNSTFNSAESQICRSWAELSKVRPILKNLFFTIPLDILTGPFEQEKWALLSIYYR